MTSSQPFASSPVSPSSTRRRKSRFTFKHLAQLALSSTSCPLRVIAHIDLDAFYAQCEMVRLGVAENQPLAVQQWSGLIAVNYPARSFGITRFIPITEAKQKCPDLIMQHVATWKEGEDAWAYREDSFKNMDTQKVSLDPYRLESRRILAVIKEALPAAPIQRVEKASIDEVFLDLSAQIHGILLERHPELSGPPPYDDPTEKLPTPPTTALDWNADALIDLNASQKEEDAPDWDDITMLVGSEIVRMVRAKIRERLKYTCSAGVARNKMLAKLGSAHKKPNSQTVIRNRAVHHFLSDFKFTKIRNLGGKLGDEVVSMFKTDTVKDLLETSLDQLKRLGDDTGTWLYQTIRGDDFSEVNSRTQIKSMLSAKSFRPSINTFEQAIRWLRIFVEDIYARLVEEGVTGNKRRPKSINLHHRQGGTMRSRQAPIPQGKAITDAVLFDLAKNLLAQVIVDGRAWPCANLQLSVGGFEDGVSGNHGIGGFLVRGEEAKAIQAMSRLDDDGPPNIEHGSPQKKRRVDEPKINEFFTKHESSDDAHGNENEYDDPDDVPSAQIPEDRGGAFPDFNESEVAGRGLRSLDIDRFGNDDNEIGSFPSFQSSDSPDVACMPNNDEKQLASTFVCRRCQKTLLDDQKDEHEDWHFAQELQDQEQMLPAPSRACAVPPAPVPSRTPKATRGRGRPPSGGTGRVEKGQSKLAFGS